ncbi:hypothetical protein [Kineosporia succinea]|uniref:ATP/maltotriose-dependent transcriptional regulator MalT n=1 Tax=Kineosporia succinea TaxID=84632 RepID=A0ABT9PDZ7_9ACTN|nr:hypothetical protein [Kineosporia succinea]MDP9830953.1 ATP/maltotriose-dependent transcriptional regulator MalT [Kineosporia succinea]
MPFADAAQAAFRAGDTAAVTGLAETELRRSTADGDLAGQVESRYYLARVALRGGDLVAAGRLAELALAVAASSGDRALEERPRHVLAAVSRMSGDLPRARLLYEQSIALNLALGHERTVATEYYNLAMCELGLGDLERAAQIVRRFRRSVLEQEWDDLLPYVCLAQASLASAQGDHESAALMIGLCEAAFAALGQVPDPDDDAELKRLRATLGRPSLVEVVERGRHLDPRTVLQARP